MSAGPVAEAPTFPERVGRYELLLPIGSGGMATVYLARVQVVGDVYRQVALKLLHPFVGEDGAASRAMMEEARLAVRIRHPNVVAVVEAGDDPCGLYLVMDYVEGDTLGALARSLRAEGRTIPLPIAGRVFLDALSGLHAAHELRDDEGRRLNLVHRDFSPQNILVGTDGISRLTDFGVAKAENQLSVTSSGIIKGKAAYMSPEQALGKRIDRRCDLWAAGVVAWEILAGQRLYREQDNVATLVRVVTEPPPRLREVRPDVPALFDEIIHEALCSDVERRIPTAAELRRRLAEAWKAHGELADQSEVGEFVSRLAAEKLGARREQITHVLGLRAARPTLVGDAEARSPDSVPRALRLPEDSTGAISASSLSAPTEASLSALPVRKRGPLLVIGAVGVGVVAIAAGIWAAGAAPGASASTAAAASAPSPVAPPSAPPAEAPVAAVSKPSRSAIEVRSNAPIRSVEIDGKAAKVRAGARQAIFTLAPEQRTKDVRVTALATDGRRATAEVSASSAEAKLDFRAGARAQSSPTKTAPVVPDSKKSPELPGLAPTPYDPQ